MELINQRVKKIMEECKERARDAGLSFDKETLEYIVTNRDLIELQPKVMIPTMYDYWVHDVEVLREKGKYELYPSNPYETVINTRPAISFYNDNNPDWLNVMIFYHVLAHIDFFQNNIYFSKTWDYDFNGQALSDKRLIAKLRSERGRWVDYVIEFGRGIDNLVGYFTDLNRTDKNRKLSKLDFYLDTFLQDPARENKTTTYIKEVERYNECCQASPESAELDFFKVVHDKYPEFNALYEKMVEKPKKQYEDLFQFIMENSTFLNKEENKWMLPVLQVVRNTSIYFQPQIRTKIMNEGWASYWHEKLFLADDRIKGEEILFARTHSAVTSMPFIGLNPYAIGMRLFQYIEEYVNKGKYSLDFSRVENEHNREHYDKGLVSGNDFIFNVRKTMSDYTFITTFLDQDFVNKHKLFVAGKRKNEEKKVFEYYIKSRKAEDYKHMITNDLYHPPHVTYVEDKEGTLIIRHSFEGKPLVKDYIKNTLIGIEYLWGNNVKLETTEVEAMNKDTKAISWRKVTYTLKDRQLYKEVLR